MKYLKLISLSILLSLTGCETIKEIVNNPTILDGVRELVKLATDKVAEKNPIYAASLDELNIALAKYQGDDIKGEDVANLIYASIGNNPVLKSLLAEELQEAIQGITASGEESTAESVISEAIRLL